MSIPDSERKKRYDKENTKHYTIKLNKNTDSDIIKRLDEVPNKQAYIKEAVREKIKQEK